MSNTAVHTHILTVLAAGSADAAPERIMLFPQGGAIRTRDGRAFAIDFARLMARFQADGLKVPLDINHATEILAPKGERADPVGFVTALEQDGAALYGRVEWIDPASAPSLLKAYPYVSPAFPAPNGEALWLKSVALVASPALAAQPALAQADPSYIPEIPMKTVLAALGLAETASEAECLAAITTLKTTADPTIHVPKAVHEETVAKLAAVSTELDTLRGTQRTAKVEAVIEGALQAKKILPAQRDHYAALCATDAGLAAVEQLLANAPELLGASGLGSKTPPDGDPALLSADDREVIRQLGLTEAEFRAANGLPAA